MDHSQQRSAIEEVSELDPRMARFNPRAPSLWLLSTPPKRLFPLGTRKVSGVGAALVVGTDPNDQSKSIDLNQDFSCVLLLRPATSEEVRKDKRPDNEKPVCIERLRLNSIAGGFEPTGAVSQLYVPF